MNELAQFNPAERVILEEACRIADRLDTLDQVLSGDASGWMRLKQSQDGSEVTVTLDNALSEARQQANVLKQLVASLRIPDEVSGKRPQQRGGSRGAYRPSAAKSAGTVTSLRDRLRQPG
ncbi:hypothetical protein DKT68_15330 [Micromonospora acroterricola]|uniref:Terminase small subunit n=1 Tax=Micromonospora acroterricola TaxID=2202421 RepID=A0A317D4A7_9ACTN|nr:hypothetical protein [Micromonospora acroterricola]PWR08586.1 hypothetical protein DKT68_15330 [Micromonospora acroterricola]